MKRALEGIKVLEIGDQLTQFTGKMLADMGAEVIKVEPPNGVEARQIGPFYNDEQDPNKSLYFWHYNTSKKSIILDLTKESDREKYINLLPQFDVVLEDFMPGTLKEWGLDFDTLSSKYPALIICSITPFGQTGPWSQYKMCDITQLALGGVMAVNGYDDVEGAPPIAPTGGQAANMAANFAAIGIVSALFHRDFGQGQGQHLDISVHDCVTVSTEMSIPYWEYQKAHVKRHTARHALPNKSSRWIFKCKDDRYILCLNTYLDEKRWREIVKWLASKGMEGKLSDERYVDDNFRATKMNTICDVLEEFCLIHESEYIFHYAQSINLPWAVIRAPEEMLQDPHLTEDRKAFVNVEHPELKETFQYPGAPYNFNKTPWEISSRPPMLGEHNEEIENQYASDKVLIKNHE
ncbi:MULTISPECIES: CaiB/BaiF CoA-transferase family protein [unclassified Sporosarcina]|uniref:CaiB/BaiF CoA transferase family protein n=1 Tax=unclassified Sporosarcina TaxID=2647733 RepID=UPI00203B6C64|nr:MULTISPECIES: CoA transferase [unclassified Sporosarcina]GKV65262.1 succinyl-CoA--D-citramalate CoA-transferase [Sporosarcina sp. NCCP-2331]GLB55386.1 succinyl-CoA--D-citramalate CoA-transferase [Sporosarcina sp. NCCP-2378]